MIQKKFLKSFMIFSLMQTSYIFLSSKIYVEPVIVPTIQQVETSTISAIPQIVTSEKSEKGVASSKPVNSTVKQTPLPKKPWTSLVYMAADNDLGTPFAGLDQKEMESIGSNQNLNILIYLNKKLPGESKVSQKIFVEKGKSTIVAETPNLDSGAASTLSDALNWATTSYPSDHIVVVLWDHGSGPNNRKIEFTEIEQFGLPQRKLLSYLDIMPGIIKHDNPMTESRAVCYDDTTGNFLKDKDLVTALKSIKQNVDVFAFDACLMANIETAITLQPYANFMVASQQTIPGDGYGYERFLGPLSQKSLVPSDLAKLMVSAYTEEYKNSGDDYTLSAVDLSKFDIAVSSVSNVADALLKLLSSADATATKNLIKNSSATKACCSFPDSGCVDICNFFANMLTNISKMKFTSTAEVTILEEALNSAVKNIMTAIIANTFNSTVRRNAFGLSIYQPQGKIDPTYTSLIALQKIPSWGTILKKIH